jgi:hypothetical protein
MGNKNIREYFIIIEPGTTKLLNLAIIMTKWREFRYDYCDETKEKMTKKKNVFSTKSVSTFVSTFDQNGITLGKMGRKKVQKQQKNAVFVSREFLLISGSGVRIPQRAPETIFNCQSSIFNEEILKC